MFALLSSHSPLLPYAAGSAPRTTQADPDFAHPVSGTDPVRTARFELASTWFAFGRIVELIRCRPAAKQNVVPAGLEFTIDWASSPGSITVPTHGPATAGPASSESTVGVVGSLGSTGSVGVVVGFLVGVVDAPGFFEGAAVVWVAFGCGLPGVEVVFPGRCEGSTRDAACSAVTDLAAVVALFSLAITGSATVTTASAAAISAANHNFLNALSWERETRCSRLRDEDGT